jgi:hypothetical protein
MLSPADVVTAKLLIQLEAASADDVRAAMRTVMRTPRGAPDLVGQLQEEGHVPGAVAARVRRYQALFELVRLEAIYLRTAERRQPPLDKKVIGEVLARVEMAKYRERLGQVLIHMGLLSVEEATSIERRSRRKLQKEDIKVLERYAKEDFSGVARPLLPVSRIHTGVFKVSSLFRGKDTLMHVSRAMLELQSQGQAIGPAELMPDDDSVEVALGDSALEKHQERSTSRMRPVLEARAETGLEGRKAIDHYEVVECVGQGGMGAVYLAKEEGLGDMVAVKVMLPGADAADLARFEREISLMAQIDHPRVVQVHAEGRSQDGLRYLVMPFYAGRDLHSALETGIDLALTLDTALQLLDALEGVHRAGVVHRDIKPENVFLLAGAGADVRLVDFGIARALSDEDPDEQRAFRSRAGVISGSPAYIAPETITGEAASPQTDVYSFGVLLFRLLTGRFPLFAESPYDYLREHLVGVPLSLAQGKRDVGWDEGLEVLMARMLAKAPTERPSAKEARDTLLERRETILAAYARGPVETPAARPGGLMNRFFGR